MAEMEKLEREPKCWGCGKPQSACDCEDKFNPIKINPPKMVLPFCGSSESMNMDEPWYDTKRYTEVMPRPCCKCDQFWESTHHEHLHGLCPHCGARGADGIGGDPKKQNKFTN